MDRWKGKVAFVTGANGGIGMAITVRLLDLGLAVVAIDKQTELLLVSAVYYLYRNLLSLIGLWRLTNAIVLYTKIVHWNS